MDQNSGSEVKVKDLLEPFTIDEFTSLIFPSKLQGYFVRPVSKIMLEEKMTSMEAIQKHAQNVKRNLDSESTGEEYSGNFLFSFFKFLLLSSCYVFLPPIVFIIVCTHLLAWVETTELSRFEIIPETFTLLTLILFVWLAYKVVQNFSITQKHIQRFLISVYKYRWNWVVVSVIMFFISTIAWYEEKSSNLLSNIVLESVAYFGSDEYEMASIPSEIISFANATLFAVQVFLAAVLLMPKFSNFLLSAIEIPYQRSALRAKFAEKNLDLLIHPKRPYDMQNELLENYPGFGDQERNSQQMIEFQGDLQRAKDDGITFDNPKLHELFTKTAHEALCPKLKHYEWCLVGLWAFGDISPVEDSDWTAKPQFRRFAQEQFSQVFFDYISQKDMGTKTTRDAFNEQYSKDGFFDHDKSERLCKALLVKKPSPERKLFDDLHKEVVG